VKAIKYLSFFLLFLNTQQTYPQNHKILIYDPSEVSESFQYSFSMLSDDSVFVADTIDENINNFDALFIFIGYPYVLSQNEGNRLIEYLSLNKPIYLYSELGVQEIDSVAFWNYINVIGIAWLPLLVPVDFVEGVDTMFTKNVLIDTSFISGSIPVVFGDVVPILTGVGDSSLSLTTTYIPLNNSINVIIDLYNLINHIEFLERVLQHFGLKPLIPQIQFYPPTDTAYILGGCTTPEIISHNLISTPIRDSISIEPGFNTDFMYYDSLGYPVYIENFYFIAIDSLNDFEYELWFHPKTYPPFDPVLILFDSTFYIDLNDFDIQLIAKRNGIQVDSFTQPFRADYGLEVEDADLLPREFNLSQNYPNPFNPNTTINYQISELSFVTLKVYDVLGNEIATFVKEEKPAGSYEVEFNATGLPSGVYFYRLQAGSFVETKKMVLMK